MKAENLEKKGYLQRDSVEHEEYAGAHSIRAQEHKEKGHAEEDLLEKILSSENLNIAYKRVKSKKGAAGVDGMTVNEVLTWLKENGKRSGDENKRRITSERKSVTDTSEKSESSRKIAEDKSRISRKEAKTQGE